MKTLEQLGISPVPWRINDHASVLDRYFEIISGQYGPYNWHNASLMAAAPKLYGKAYEVAENLLVHLAVPSQTISMNRAEVAAMVKDLQSALAEAAGESEVKDEA